ncbi:MAG: PaaI family thioesterase [Candidatus Hodarchaeales archaeon]|jgi:acyl-coenzyme A thioesterase PaaI-like protein
MKSEAFQDQWPDIGANCWGCGRNNEHGLKIKSYWDGDEAVCVWEPKEYHIAFPGVLNGGIIASIIDCHCLNTANAAYAKENGLKMDSLLGGGFMTGMLNVKFVRPTPVKTVNLHAKIIEMGEKKIKVSCELYSGEILCATGGITAVRVAF